MTRPNIVLAKARFISCIVKGVIPTLGFRNSMALIVRVERNFIGVVGGYAESCTRKGYSFREL